MKFFMTLAAIPYRVVLSSGGQRRLIAAAAGALSSLAMAPYDLWPVLAITFPIFVWLLDGTGTGRSGLTSAFASGWWFGFGYFLAGLYWIGMAFLVEADRFAWLLPVAVILLPAGLAAFHRPRRGHRPLSVDAGTEPDFCFRARPRNRGMASRPCLDRFPVEQLRLRARHRARFRASSVVDRSMGLDLHRLG